MESYYFDCQCSSSEHTLRFNLDSTDGHIYISTHLTHFLPWYKRVLQAVKYIFGYHSKYGHFDCTELKPNEYSKLKELLDESSRLFGPNQNYTSYGEQRIKSSNSFEFVGIYNSNNYLLFKDENVEKLYVLSDFIPRQAFLNGNGPILYGDGPVGKFKIEISFEQSR